MDLLTQLNSAMKYIEDHICDDIALTDVSETTSYSAYHFGRLFYYIAEMPLSEYIRKRKLTLAAMELQNPEIRVIDIAVKYGYDSADSFTRAFIRQHGLNPTASRQKGAALKIFPPLSFQIKIEGVQEMNWRIEKKEAFEVFGVEKILKSDELSKASEFWDECAADGSRSGLHNQSAIYGITGYYDSGENTVPYMICAPIEAGCKTDGYKTVQIPELTWAIFHIDGLKDHGDDNCQIHQLFTRVYSEWLPASGYEKANGPDVEYYGDGFEEVWIPIIKK